MKLPRMCRLTYAWAAAVVLLSGCVTTQRGAVTGTRRVVGSEREVSTTLEVEVSSLPTHARPTLAFTLRSRVRRTYQVRQQHSAVRRASVSLNVLGAAAWGGLAYWGITEGESRVAPSGDTLTTAGWLIRAGGGVAAVVGLFTLIRALDDSEVPVPGLRLDGRAETRTEVVEGPPPRGELVLVAVGDAQRSLATDIDGAVRLNVVSDLALEEFDEPTEIPVSVSAPRLPEVALTTINSRAWTRECLRMVSSGSVFERPSALSGGIGSYSRGDRFDLLSKDDVDWLEISFRGRSGWVPRLAGTTCWVAPR